MSQAILNTMMYISLAVTYWLPMVIILVVGIMEAKRAFKEEPTWGEVAIGVFCTVAMTLPIFNIIAACGLLFASESGKALNKRLELFFTSPVRKPAPTEESINE